MSFLKILLFCFFLINVSTSTDTKDLEVNNVLALTNSNFDKTIANNKYILVLFCKNFILVCFF
jgi:hypothetical protein